MIDKRYPDLFSFCLLSLFKKKTREDLGKRDKIERGKKGWKRGWEDKRIEEVIFSCANILSRQKAPQQHWMLNDGVLIQIHPTNGVGWLLT